MIFLLFFVLLYELVYCVVVVCCVVKNVDEGGIHCIMNGFGVTGFEATGTITYICQCGAPYDVLLYGLYCNECTY